MKNERDAVHHLKSELEQRDVRLSGLREEGEFNNDNIRRLEAIIRQRDGELSEYSERMMERRQENEELRDELGRIKKDWERTTNEHKRELDDALIRRNDLQIKLEEMVKTDAEKEILISGMRAENEMLKKRVDEIVMQGGVDRDMRIVSLQKNLEKSEEDKRQLNIALDSKQQELELVSVVILN